MPFRQVTQLLSRRLIKYSRLSVRQHNFKGEAETKTHMSMITREDESHNYIVAYSNYGIRLASGLSVLGPCAVFPRAILHWNVPSAEKITPESLSLFVLLEPKLDILIIGKGDKDAKVDMNIYKYLKSKKINFEILPTEQACSTFNFLNADRRVVAAGIIPPQMIQDDFGGNDSPQHLQFDDQEALKEEMLADVEKMVESFKNDNAISAILKSEARRKQKQESPKKDVEDISESDGKGSQKR